MFFTWAEISRGHTESLLIVDGTFVAPTICEYAFFYQLRLTKYAAYCFNDLTANLNAGIIYTSIETDRTRASDLWTTYEFCSFQPS